ncbi:hypothetical protein [Bdellovibrio svalbardensis]|uniref:Uncharacterized protein n=1 Tax=Bdellovibrio svalbardensis TaxID=2972972 RepID=A0ABT6DIF1_9BACT|nr:hypothetical protein [Bdellovibrio svalbardensis]MDG0816287.1 hypothetical protein [Bdellovibrio svalbardensis]
MRTRKASPSKSRKKISKKEDQLVSHENDLFDEEEDFESPRRNPSQARPSEFEDSKSRRGKRTR